jgi:hypothetical protein
MEPLSKTDAARVWRNGLIPVIYEADDHGRIMVRAPYSGDTRQWLKGTGRIIEWLGRYRAWELPASRFDDVVQLSLERYGKVYIIQPYRPFQKCAPACWNAKGSRCQCSCLGKNHQGNALDHVVSETFAFQWDDRQLACRLLTKRTREDVATADKSLKESNA